MTARTDAPFATTALSLAALSAALDQLPSRSAGSGSAVPAPVLASVGAGNQLAGGRDA
jgi:hypothetical protein